MIVWGGLCMAHAAIKSDGSLIALRLLLGAAESGFNPAAFYLLSSRYPRYIVGLRMGIYAGMYAVAGAFAGLIAYGLLHIDLSRLHGWQPVFFVRGRYHCADWSRNLDLDAE